MPILFSARVEDHHAEISSGVSVGERNDESAHKAEFLRERPDRHRVVKKEKTIPATDGRVGQANSTRQAEG